MDLDEVIVMEFNKEIFVMFLCNMVMFLFVVMFVIIGCFSILKLINVVYKKKFFIVVVCQIQGDMDDFGFNDVYYVGVIGKIFCVFEMLGGNIIVIMQLNGFKVYLDSIIKMFLYLKGMVIFILEVND